MLAASGSLVFFMDVDLSTPLNFIGKFLAVMAAGECDIVFGSRNLPASVIPVRQPFFRQLLGKGFALLTRLLVLPGVADSQCGFKLFKAECARDIFKRVTVDGWAFDVQALAIARKLDYKAVEWPVVWQNDDNSKVKPAGIFRMLLDLFKVRFSLGNLAVVKFDSPHCEKNFDSFGKVEKHVDTGH